MKSDAICSGASPIAIGGIGGSGTRLLARLLMELGYFMGPDLNESLDNLWFTLLFKRPAILEASPDEFSRLARLFVNGMTGGTPPEDGDARFIDLLAHESRPAEFPVEWFLARAASLKTARMNPSPVTWGWKEPNTHIVIPRLRQCLPGLKYVHVMRNGLDMAFSGNQTQLRFWGAWLIGDKIELTPRYSLKYWRVVHERILTLGQEMEGDLLLLDYDQFCRSPAEGLSHLLAFLGLDISRDRQSKLISHVHPPASLGRFKQHGTQDFDPEDLAFATRMGYDGTL